jgi:lactoylglutathione lyase
MINMRHTGIVVNDIDKSLYFYRDLLGFEIKKNKVESGEYIDIFLGLKNATVQTVKMSLNDKGMIELLHYKTHKEEPRETKINQIGCTHIAVTVKDLDDVYSRFTKEGIEFINSPHLSADGLAKVAFCRDPDGFFIELVEEMK